MMSQHFSRFVSFLSVVAFLFSTSIATQEPPSGQILEQASKEGAPQEEYELSALRVFNRAVLLIKEQYVEPQRFKPREMLVAALEAIEQKIPEIVIGDTSKDLVSVQVGAKTESISFADMNSLWDLSFKLRDFFRFFEKNLPKERNLRDIEYAAVNGILSKLDPHSILLEPKLSNEMKLNTKGEFGGLGVVIGIRDGFLTVISPLEGTPADKAGIKSLDRVIKIGEDSTINMALDEAVDQLRGKPGTAVYLTVERKGESTPRKIKIVRAIIKVESVSQQLLSHDIGYIKVKAFHGNTAADMKRIIDELKTKSGNKLKGLVLDFRNNPGGLLDQSVAISDLFLDGGVVVVTQGAQPEKRDEEFATSGTKKTELPIVVLVNGGSASASEIVAGAIKNRDRGLVVGEQTFGKGSVQMLYDFPDRSSLKLTIAQYLTPGNESIQSVGITPDVELHPVFAKDLKMLSLFSKDYTREENLDAHLDDSERVISRKPSFKLSHLDVRLDPDESERQALSSKFKEDFDITFAKRIIKETKGSSRTQMMAAAKSVVAMVQKEESSKIEAALKNLGIDWASAPKKYDNVMLSATLSKPATGKAGGELEVKLEAKNVGQSPIYQLYGLTDSATPLFAGREFIFGKLAPGEKKGFSVKIALPKDALARRDLISVKFSGNGDQELSTLNVPIQIEGLPRPVFAYSTYVDDSRQGNADGYIEPEEKIDLVFTVKNVGKGNSNEPVILLKNLGGSEIFIDEGRKKLTALKVGDSVVEKLSFTVRKEAKVAKLQVQLYDAELGVFWSEKMDIPVRATPADVTKLSGKATLSKDANIYETPSSEGSPLATANSAIEVTRMVQVGDMVRVQLSGKISGFVNASQLKPVIGPVAKNAKEASLNWMYRRVPPRIELAGGMLQPIIAKESFHLGAKVMDEASVRDAFIFVNDKKVYYKQFGQKGPTNINFETDVKLKSGVNVITMVVREDENYAQRDSITIFSEVGDPLQKTAAARR